MLERGDLFRGAIEDRYVSAFLNAQEQSDAALARADLVATALEILRVAALSSYENKAISSGVLLVDEDARMPLQSGTSSLSYKYSAALTAIKSFYRLSDGLETLFLVNRDGVVLDIIEVDRYVSGAQSADPVILDAPSARAYRSHALATGNNRNICIVLTPSHEIKVFAQGVEIFSFRNARWHLLDVQAKYEMWERAIEDSALASRLFQTALDLADARQGALFVVLRDAAMSLPLLVAPGDRLDAPRTKPSDTPDRVQVLHMLRGRRAVSLDPAVLAGLAKTDGATVMDASGRLLAVGAILMHSEPVEPHSTLAVEGARTTAAMAAGRYASVLKVSEDGLITFYDRQERIWDI
jgi:hypothetical protein